MRQKDVLASHLKGLMAASKYDTFPKIIAASRERLSNGTLDRIRRAKSDAGLDKLEELADLFRVQPWLLTVPGVRYVQGDEGFPVVANANEVLAMIADAITAPAHTDKYVGEGKSHQTHVYGERTMGSNAKETPERETALSRGLTVKVGAKHESNKPDKVSKQRTN